MMYQAVPDRRHVLIVIQCSYNAKHKNEIVIQRSKIHSKQEIFDELQSSADVYD